MRSFPFRRLRPAVLVLPALAAAWSAPAAADCIPDQQQTQVGTLVAVVNADQDTYSEAGQVFTPSVDGTLETVSLHASRSQAQPGTAPLYLEIRATTAGLPDLGPPLLTVAIPRAEVPLIVSEFTIDVSSHELPLAAGTAYAITVRESDGILFLGLRGGNPYAPGAQVHRDTRDGPWSAATLTDAFFRTTICLAAVGAGEPWVRSTWGEAKASYR